MQITTKRLRVLIKALESAADENLVRARTDSDEVERKRWDVSAGKYRDTAAALRSVIAVRTLCDDWQAGVTTTPEDLRAIVGPGAEREGGR